MEYITNCFTVKSSRARAPRASALHRLGFPNTHQTALSCLPCEHRDSQMCSICRFLNAHYCATLSRSPQTRTLNEYRIFVSLRLLSLRGGRKRGWVSFARGMRRCSDWIQCQKSTFSSEINWNYMLFNYFLKVLQELAFLKIKLTQNLLIIRDNMIQDPRGLGYSWDLQPETASEEKLLFTVSH